MIRALALVTLAACGSDVDPCAGRAGACIALGVDGLSTRVDQLELDLLYGGIHDTITTQRPGTTSTLPLIVAIELALDEEVHVGVVAAGKLSGTVLGTGAVQTLLAPGEHVQLDLALAVPDDCTAGAFYCGGDRLAGDPQTLYQCNGGGVPIARGRCHVECSVRPGEDDTCRDSTPCVEGGYYCGGDKLDGDPSTLYRCANGMGTSPVECADGCIISPPGRDDVCR